jgi:uncharacterized membrane protein YfcA
MFCVCVTAQPSFLASRPLSPPQVSSASEAAPRRLRLSRSLALPFGLAIGLSLGLVGGGGSILAVPVLVYVLGEGVKQATTASLLIVGATALLGALDHARCGRVRWRTDLAFGAAGALGSLGGTALNRLASADAILFLFALLLLAAAYGMLRRPALDEGTQTESHGRAPWSRVAPAGLAVGALTGLFGVGGGVLIVPALVLVLGLPMRAAVGTSLLVIALTSAAQAARRLRRPGRRRRPLPAREQPELAHVTVDRGRDHHGRGQGLRSLSLSARRSLARST